MPTTGPPSPRRRPSAPPPWSAPTSTAASSARVPTSGPRTRATSSASSSPAARGGGGVLLGGARPSLLALAQDPVALDPAGDRGADRADPDDEHRDADHVDAVLLGVAGGVEPGSDEGSNRDQGDPLGPLHVA